ncbi:MAG: hypothetical protein U1E73_01805 [Planctomycetota bacterium]
MASIKKKGRAADEAQHGRSDQTLATPGSYLRNATDGSPSDDNPINALLALLYGGARVAPPESAPLKFRCPPGYDSRRPFRTTEEHAWERAEHVDTLRRRQREGGGPPFVVEQNGDVRYWVEALEEYYRGRLVNNRHQADALLRRDRQQKEGAR